MNNSGLTQAQWAAEERVKRALREAERNRLLRGVEGPGDAKAWWLPVALTLGSLLGLVVAGLS